MAPIPKFSPAFLGKAKRDSPPHQIRLQVNPAYYLGFVTAEFDLDGGGKIAPSTYVRGLLSSTIPWLGPIETVILAAEISQITSES